MELWIEMLGKGLDTDQMMVGWGEAKGRLQTEERGGRSTKGIQLWEESGGVRWGDRPGPPSSREAGKKIGGTCLKPPFVGGGFWGYPGSPASIPRKGIILWGDLGS